MKTTNPQLDAKIDEIRSWMFGSDMKEVAKRARKDKTHVSKVLNRKCGPNKIILDKAIEVMNENKVRFGCEPMMKAS